MASYCFTLKTNNIIIIIIIIIKFHPRTGNEGPEGEQVYSSTLSSASALDGVGS
jgi:hypothetical protein